MDSRFISEDIVPTLTERLKNISIGSYSKHVQSVLQSKLNITKRFVDGGKVTDHHAIIPTEQVNQLYSTGTSIFPAFFVCACVAGTCVAATSVIGLDFFRAIAPDIQIDSV